MEAAKPSRTAYRVALRRAVHQLIDNPKVFDDPLAIPIVGSDAASKAANEEHLPSRSLRAFIAVRSRYGEDQLAKAVKDGVRQYVILGAGLDTFAYRNPHPGLRVFEVDHPATQQWKRERLQEAGIPIPHDVVFVAVDFERQTLSERLQQAGFEASQPMFCSWLGVVPYLTKTAFELTLQFLASMPPSSGLVFDYAIPRSSLNPVEQAAFDALATRVSSVGEPFQLFLDPQELASKLQRMGFNHVENLEVAEINSRYFAQRADGLSIAGRSAHLLCARI
jgi:methyltransferase (TIGR00027 family)